MNFDLFYKVYLNSEEHILDPYQYTIKLLPFTSNISASTFDDTCGLSGITGAFFRMCNGVSTDPIIDYCTDADAPVTQYLSSNKGMKDNEVTLFRDIMKDIMTSNDEFIPFDASLLRYIPLHTTDISGKKKADKYASGQSKIADYLVSMLGGKKLPDREVTSNNLFSTTIKDALGFSKIYDERDLDEEYYILPFIKDSFRKDIEWLLAKEDNVLIKYIDILLYFYACFSVMQTTLALNAETCSSTPNDKPKPLFYILDKETASAKRQVVINGWSTKLPNEYIEKLYGRMQALDIANTLLSDEHNPRVTGLYHDVLYKMEETPFEDVKDDLEKLLVYYRENKIEILKKRESGKKLSNLEVLDDLSVSSYQEFLIKLEKLCKTLQSSEYHAKMRKRVIDMMKVHMIRPAHGRGQTALILDETMLRFLVAMITKEERVKLKDLYSGFTKYGIEFDMHTRKAIEDFLLKYNLLERRSDSGEAQYVRIVL